MKLELGVKVIKEEVGTSYWLLFYRDEMMIVDSDIERIPYLNAILDFRSKLSELQYLGLADGKEVYFAELSEKIDIGNSQFRGLRTLFGLLENDWYWLANRAYHLLNWRKKNHYCGSCGNKLADSENEVALICRQCGNIIYPKISPAVIVAIVKGEQILLARSERFPQGMYSVIAGFVEPGETLEECVVRETQEEVGIKVSNVRYFCSQPWPYPDSLMLAFTAEYESGEIKIDEKEIVDANWYTKNNLPSLPMKSSVARKLIDWFCTK